MANEVSEERRFRFILDAVPEWWINLPNVQIEVGSTIALIPNSEPALPGDWIILGLDGRVRTESDDAGRIEARKFLARLRKEVGI